MPDWSWIRGKTALITGASTGIGLATVKLLAENGARVLMVGRNPEATSESAAAIRAAVPAADVQTFLADLLLQSEIRRLAEWTQSHAPVHVLINNVGAVYPTRELTVDGVERQFAVNCVNQFYLTRLVLPVLTSSASPDSKSRVVMVSSLAHRRANDVTNAFAGDEPYQPLSVYRKSKLGQCLSAIELSRRLADAPISVNSLCPGFTRTGIGAKHTSGAIRFGWSLASWFFRTPETAARTVMFAAASPELESVTGQFIENEQVTSYGKAALDPKLAADLWAESCARLKFSPELS